MDGQLSMQDYAVSKWFQHLNALATIYNEEDFRVEDSSATLKTLCSSLSIFLDRYTDDIPGETIKDSVKEDYAVLDGLEVYTDLTRVMNHVARYMDKGLKFRNDICVESLKKVFTRNRELIENLSADSSKSQDNQNVLALYYGPKRFKCSFVTCIDFYEGFTSAEAREKHINKHNRPWVCEVQHCSTSKFGFTSNNELDKHTRDYHPDRSDLSELFKITPKKVTPTSKHSCHICGKFFTRRYHKINHINSHMNEKPYSCTICGKDFTRENDRKRHEKIHTK